MSQAVARQLLGLKKQILALKKSRQGDYLAHDYRNYLYGGWRHPSGRWVDRGHIGAQRFHEACKARFCATCTRCTKHKDECACGASQALCWAFVGSAPVREEAGGEGEEAVRVCPKHGATPWRRTNYYTTCAMFPGNKYCLGGETLVWTGLGWRRIDEITQPVTVAAWDGAQWVPAVATGHILKGPDPLYRVSLASGRSFVATAGHRVLAAGQQWRRVDELVAGSGLLSSSLAPPPSSAARDPSVHAADARRWSRTTPGSRCGCPACRRYDGEQPQWPATTAPDGSPSRVGVRRCTRLRCACWATCSRTGGHTPESARSHSRRWSDRPASVHARLPGAGLAASTGCLVAEAPPSSSPARSQSGLQPTHGYGLQPQSTAGSAPEILTAPCVACPQSWDSFVDTVILIDYERTDFHYDLSVPGYENFLAEGTIQHNSKTSVMIAEMAAGVIGYRPWDDTLSCIPAGSGRIHLVVCQTFSTSALLTITPLVERYLQAYIVKALVTSSHVLSGWMVRGSDGVGQDILKLASQDQHYRNTSAVSPIEGVNPVQLAWDEPMEGDIRATATRGLLPALGVGAGCEYVAATLLEGSAKAAAYMRGEIWDKAAVNGGTDNGVYAMTGLSSDNPAYTHSEIQTYLNRFPPWEREARFNGTTTYRRGLIIPDFQIDVHVYDEAYQDPLVDLQTKEPTDHPIFMAVDPHDVRPWMMKWVTILQEGAYQDEKGRMIYPARVVREWPEGAFREMRHFSHAEPGFGGSYKDYARVIEAVEKTIPGGAQRVVRRFMDPAFGDSLKMGSTGDTVAKQMAKTGYRFVTDIPREVEPGHNILRLMVRGSWSPGKEVDGMHKPHLLVNRRCTNTIWAFLNYVNDDGSNPAKIREKPGEAGKDDIDCLRYIFVMRPAYASWRNRDRWYADQVRAIQENLAHR